ncbi:MAG: 2-C-methyl-D-erythritol 2,4-cyclodiphosphate synthase [Bdellovibrionales bacterium]|nr:2-C-methyl-D-erythritol 2,4-cyclodiphosphate synthase [Bdellovibrionales bacterium]
MDVHQFVEGRPLILGGVTIPHDRGLEGHSDADALLHAITDALLGAVGKGDIGTLFPDTEQQWKGADSADLLRRVVQIVRAESWDIVNVDCTVMTEAPKLNPLIDVISNRIAKILQIPPACCNVKATTCEKMGFLGRGEGLMATAVVLLQGVQ